MGNMQEKDRKNYKRKGQICRIYEKEKKDRRILEKNRRAGDKEDWFSRKNRETEDKEGDDERNRK